MKEQRIIKIQLLKNMIVNLILLTVIFGVFSLFILNQFNNSLNNLEWTTSEENENFRDFYNENNYELFNKKFSDDQVILICNAMINNYSYLEICYYILHIPYTGIVHKRLTDIQRGITYKHITKDIFGFGAQRLSPKGL